MINRDLKNVAYDTIRNKLINCEYPPGHMLNEAQLAAELGFSRTPIRQALNRIEQEGIIKILPKKGIYITEVSLNDVRQIFQTRLEIEPVALRMAGPMLPADELIAFRRKFIGEEDGFEVDFRLDTAMHLFLIEHCGNRFIIEMMRRVFDENTRIIISSGQSETKIHDACIEHVNILNLLIKQNYCQAQEAMRLHVEECKKAALDYFYESQSNNFNSSHTYLTHLENIKK